MTPRFRGEILIELMKIETPEQKAIHEAGQLIELFKMCTSSKDEAKRTAMFSVQREVEMLESLNKQKYIVHWAQDKFNQLLNEKNLVLNELKNTQS